MDDKLDPIDADLVTEFRGILLRPLTKAEMRTIELRVIAGCAIDPVFIIDEVTGGR